MIETVAFWDRVTEAYNTTNVLEIARRLGLSKQALYKWQKGKLPELDTLIKICESTSISLHWLLYDEGEKFPSKKTIASAKSLHKNEEQTETLVKSKSIESIEVKLSGDYEIKLAPNRIEIRGTIKSLQRRT